YGYYEARFRVPPGSGWHTSFWTQRYIKGTSESLCQEIDICEQYSGSPTGYNVCLHDWSGKHKVFGTQWIQTPNLHEDFHVWGCEFTPTHVRYYFEGELVHEKDATQLEHGDGSIWLTSIASNWSAKNGVDDAQLPSAAVFDYVRFYEKKPEECCR
ncbi:MAG: glycoside hydrolase family 16 protein, partial [Verrucomicrobiales bacterium]